MAIVSCSPVDRARNEHLSAMVSDVHYSMLKIQEATDRPASGRAFVLCDH